jgi:anaerobic magnesium-protoporphyrin IX monomethyl ester cyclase
LHHYSQKLSYTCYHSETFISIRKNNHNLKKIIFTWSTRGCAFNCNYCSNGILNQKLKYGIRSRNIGKLVQEIEHLNKTYDFDILFFSDENFLYNTDYCLEFVQRMKGRIENLTFGFLSRPEHINNKNIDLLKKLKNVGWRWVSIGIEIGNEEKRNLFLNRKNTNNEIVKAFEICNEIGVATNAFLISGLYFEDSNDLLITEDLLLKCQPNSIECSIIFPLRGTKIFSKYKNKNMLYKEEGCKNYFRDISVVHPEYTHTQLRIIKKYFENMPHKKNTKGNILTILN